MKYCILTNDVELTSIVNNNLNTDTGKKVLEDGLPKLLNLYRKYGIKSTFFITGKYIEEFHEVIPLIENEGHEIGCHGYSHEIDQAFDMLSLKEQINNLNKVRNLYEKHSNNALVSFRAPALRTNEFTVNALESAGFKFDSSVASQRFDFFLSFGGLKKLKWLFSPRMPYNAYQKSLAKKGFSKIMEIPISALLMPYIGTTMRVFPLLTKFLRYILHYEAIFTGKPIVFLIHPVELITESKKGKFNRRSKNLLKYLLTDKLRRWLKMKNLGDDALFLYEEEIRFFQKKGYKFLTIKEYGDLYGKIRENN